MACPSDPEALRPKNFIEAISGNETWESVGIRIKWTDPVVPGNLRMPINESVKLRLCVETKPGFNVLPDHLSAWCWTHIRSEDNPCGIWREIRLLYNPRCTIRDDQGITSHVFQSSVVPTSDDLYRLTFNIKYEKLMIWANYFQVDNLVDVQVKPSVGTQYDAHVCPVGWKGALQCMFPQAYPVYAAYFSDLFSDKKSKDNQQSTSAHGTREIKIGRKKMADDSDEVEMYVRL